MKSLFAAVIGTAIILVSTMGSSNAANGVNLRTGLWEVTLVGHETQKKQNNNYVAGLRTKMNDLPDILRSRLEKMIGKHADLTNGPGRVCITPQTLKQAPISALGPAACEEKVNWSLEGDDAQVFLSCPDGSAGLGNLVKRNSKQIDLWMKMKGGPNGKTEHRYIARFVDKNCGNVRPN